MWWPYLNTAVGSLPHLKMTRWSWLPLFASHGVNGNVYPLFWGGRGQTPRTPDLLQGSFSGKTIVCIRYLGDEPQDRTDTHHITPQGGPPSGGNAYEAKHSGEVGSPASGCNGGGGGPTGVRYIHHLTT